MRDKWKILLGDPLTELAKTLNEPLTIAFVIDALDECEATEVASVAIGNDVQRLISILASEHDLGAIRIRTFITSRPEIDVKLGFQRVTKETLHHEVLNKVSLSQPESRQKDDIAILLEHEFVEIRKIYKTEQNWSGKDSLYALAQRSEGLFIYAHTACLFLYGGTRGYTGTLDERLHILLAEPTSQHNTAQTYLDNMYQRVLKASFLGTGAEQVLKERSALFKKVIGPFMALLDPLSVTSFKSLVFDVKRSAHQPAMGSQIDGVLECLHSVIEAPESSDGVARLIHLSFQDFLFDKARCTHYF